MLWCCGVWWKSKKGERKEKEKDGQLTWPTGTNSLCTSPWMLDERKEQVMYMNHQCIQFMHTTLDGDTPRTIARVGHSGKIRAQKHRECLPAAWSIRMKKLAVCQLLLQPFFRHRPSPSR